jgi:DNA polymerase III subunit epsilon
MEQVKSTLELDPMVGLACALDTETTGLNPKVDRVISFGYVEIIDGHIGKSVEWFFNPGNTPIHPDAQKVHGLTAEFLADKPPIKQYLPRIIELVVEMIVCGHNVKFDLDMLNGELARHRLPPIENYIVGVYDTMKEAKKRWPGKPASLDAVCSRLEVSIAHREKHGALIDAMLCAQALVAMRRGQRSLLDQQGTPETMAIGADQHDTFPMAPVLVLTATAQEQTEHDNYLAELRAKGNEPVWYMRDSQDEPEPPRPN